MDLKLTDYDLDLANGELTFVRGKEAIAQHVTMRLRTWLEETPYDVTAGVPWAQIVFRGKNPDLLETKLILEQQILQTPGVTGVNLTLTFDRSSRILQVTGTVQSVDGEIDFSTEISP